MKLIQVKFFLFLPFLNKGFLKRLWKRLSDEPLLAAGDNNWFTAQRVVVHRSKNVGAGKAAVLGSVCRWRHVVQQRLGLWRRWHIWMRKACFYKELCSYAILAGMGLLVTENSVIFSVRYAARSFVHKHIHMARD